MSDLLPQVHGPQFEKDPEGGIDMEPCGDHVSQLEDRAVAWAEHRGRARSSNGNFLPDQGAGRWRRRSACS